MIGRLLGKTLDRLRGTKCPICRQRTHYLAGHIYIDHAEVQP